MAVVNGSAAYLAGILGLSSQTGLGLGVMLALVAVLSLVAIRSVSVLRVQNRRLSLRENELALQREALEEHAMVNIVDANGRITYVNDNLLRRTGLGLADLIGKPYSEALMTPEGNNADEVCTNIRKGERWIGECRLRKQDGGVLWARTTIVPEIGLDGTLRKSIAMHTDITETKLREQEGSVRVMFDRLQDEVYVFSVDDLRLHYMNKSARAFHGWSECQYRTKTIADTTDGFDEARFRQRIAPLVAGEIEALIYESELFGRPFEINLQIETSLAGQKRLLAVLRDISQRKEVEASRAAFVATVSHELRAPLTSVKGALKLIVSGATGPVAEKPSTMLGLALRNVDRLIVLINDLLDLEKLDANHGALRHDPVNLPELIRDAVASNACYGQENGITFRIARDMPATLRVTGDRDRLMQVLTNLMSNAAKFSHQGGAVDLGLHDAGESARIIVTDHGIGIPAEAQERLFERFVQAETPEHKARHGTGLGLSIVKTIVERHGGQVSFESAPGQGTTFFIDLPKDALVSVAA